MTPDEAKVRNWLFMTHENERYWTDLGRQVFLGAEGDSRLAQYRLADILKRAMSKTAGDRVVVRRWDNEQRRAVEQEVVLPDIRVSNEMYVDWLRIADYLLLSSAAEWEDLASENKRRAAMSASMQTGFESRATLLQLREILDANPDKSDDECLRLLQEKHGTEAKKIQLELAKKIDMQYLAEYSPEHPPEPLPQLQPYASVYFPRSSSSMAS